MRVLQSSTIILVSLLYPCMPPLPPQAPQYLPTLPKHSCSSEPIPELWKLLRDQGAPPAQVILTRYGEGQVEARSVRFR